MSKEIFCEECGALLSPDAAFCDKCGAFVGVGPGDDPDMMTEPMPVAYSHPSTRTEVQSHAEPADPTMIRPPTPAADIARQATATRLRDGESRRARANASAVPSDGDGGQGGTVSPAAPANTQSFPASGSGDGKGNPGGTGGWVVAILIFVLAAGIVGYVLGTSGTRGDGNGTRTTGSSVQVTEKDDGTDAKKGADEGFDAKKDEADKKDTSGKDDGMDTKKDGSKSTDGDEKSDASDKDKGDSKATDGSNKDKPAAGRVDDDMSGLNRLRAEERAAREAEEGVRHHSISEKMDLRDDGQLRIGMSVPKDAKVSERIEIRQGDDLVYGSRIVAPGETLEWVPAEGVDEGSAQATIYGIVGDKDFGEPVVVDIEIVRAVEEDGE